jgi:hypothetical protein
MNAYMMKHSPASRVRSRYPVDIYYKRLIDMMSDYSISLKEAIQWDSCGFMPHTKKGVILTPEQELDLYLRVNYVPEESRYFFIGVALGQFPDYELTDEDEEETEQKDDRGTSTP